MRGRPDLSSVTTSEASPLTTIAHTNTVLSPSIKQTLLVAVGKGKVGCAPPDHRPGAHLPVKAVEPVGGWTTESVTHGQCDARPTVTSPAAERRRPLAGTKLYCLVTEADGCEQLAQSCYSVADWPGVELVTFRSRANALTTEPPVAAGISP